MTGLLALILLSSQVQPEAAPAAPSPLAARICDRHPPARRDDEQKARTDRVGLRTTHDRRLADARVAGTLLNEPDPIAGAPGPGEFEVDLGATPGGGECPSPDTLRGRAAAAVGALKYGGTSHCSAVLIGPTLVATAAHCLLGFDPSRMTFVIGRDSVDGGIQQVQVEKFAISEKYDPNVYGVDDIGVAYLAESVTEAEPIDLTGAAPPNDALTNLTYVGFGIAGKPPGVRRCVDIPVNDVCTTTFSNQNVNLNTCNGDSGGGVFLDKDGQVSLVGLTTWGDPLCQKFGVSANLKAYTDFLKARLGEADPNRPRATVAKAARRYREITPGALMSALKKVPPGMREAAFTTNYRLKWVRWKADVSALPAPGRYAGCCDVVAQTDGVDLVLQDVRNGCDYDEGGVISFDGRLARVGPGMLALVDVEPSRVIAAARTAAVVELVHDVQTTEKVRESRSRQLRLESEHGFWTGRKTECAPVVVEAPWELDPGSIRFEAAHSNHGGVGMPPEISQAGFCVPVWAEGFGGARLGGLTLDAGQTGVISGTVFYTVTREQATTRSEVLTATSLPEGSHVDVSVPGGIRKEDLKVRIKSARGEAVSTLGAPSVEGVSVDWQIAGSRIRVQDLRKQ